MKADHKSALRLNRETVRDLSAAEMHAAAGGAATLQQCINLTTYCTLNSCIGWTVSC